MDTKQAIETLSALGQTTRLDVWRRLVRVLPDGLPAGQLALQLNIPQNTLSSHLAQLSRAGLVHVVREGRVLRYHAEPEALRKLAVFLLADCCEGRAEICAPVLEALSSCQNENSPCKTSC